MIMQALFLCGPFGVPSPQRYSERGYKSYTRIEHEIAYITTWFRTRCPNSHTLVMKAYCGPDSWFKTHKAFSLQMYFLGYWGTWPAHRGIGGSRILGPEIEPTLLNKEAGTLYR